MSKPPKKPWRKTLTFSLSADLHDRLKKHTDSQATNTSKLLQRLVEAHLQTLEHGGQNAG